MSGLMGSRAVGLVCFAVVGWLSGCTGDVLVGPTTGPGGEGGAGSSGGGQGASGGQGGSGAATSASGGGGEGGAAVECAPECAADMGCLDGQCVPVRVVHLRAQHYTNVQLDGSIDESGGAIACEGLAGAAADPPEPLAEDGDCRVYGPLFSARRSQPEFGVVEVNAPSFGNKKLGPVDGAPNCVGGELPVSIGYFEEEEVGFQVAAGTYNPTFSMASPSPPPLSLTMAGKIAGGQPFPISWQTDGNPPLLFLFTLDGENTIECTPAAGTSLTVSAGMTSYLDGVEPYVFVMAHGSSELLETQVSPTYRANLQTERIVSHLLDFESPPL